MTSRVLQVGLGDRSYPIVVDEGGLDGLGAAMAEVFPAGPCILVTNPVVGALYAHAAMDSLQRQGFSPVLIQIPDGERYKTLRVYGRLLDDLLTVGLDRDTPVLALGGGVTGDLVGFAAATVLRGVPLVQVPTTLLAMVDSSVGGKSGVNTKHGKNLVGAFYQPRLVFAGTQVLATLDNAEWRCGLGEALKHGMIRDRALFDWMLENARAIVHRDPHTTASLVLRNCRIKADVVARDEREGGLRAVLNFGHTVAHALETTLGHGVLRHGEAVAIGMQAEARFCLNRGLTKSQGVVHALEKAMDALGLPLAVPWVDGPSGKTTRELMLAAAGMDKKVRHGRISLVVPREVGKVRLQEFSLDILPQLLSNVAPPQEET